MFPISERNIYGNRRSNRLLAVYTLRITGQVFAYAVVKDSGYMYLLIQMIVICVFQRLYIHASPLQFLI